jgi:hypothetical protein
VDEVLDDLMTAKRHVTDLLQLWFHGAFGRRHLGQHLGEAHDHRQGIAQVLGDARRHLAQGTKPLRLD